MSSKSLHRIWLTIALGIPIVTALGSSLGWVELGFLGNLGVLAAAVVSVLVNVRAWLPSPSTATMSQAERAAHLVGTLAAIASPIGVFASKAGAGVGTAIAISTLAGIATELRKAFSGSAVPAAPSAGGTVVVLFFALSLAGKSTAAEIDTSTPAASSLPGRPLLAPPQLGFVQGNWTCQLATAVTAFQYNIKTGDYKRVAMATGWGCTYRGYAVPLGAAAYGGVGLSSDHPNALQGHVLFSVVDFAAAGPGVQVFRDPDGNLVWQALLSIALNYNTGGSVDYMGQLINRLLSGG